MISIIIPVYNVAQYLDQCLQSVLGQSYTDWECILVDDGSKDDSGAKCDEWCKRDSRFHVIHQKNQGVSSARNNGIKASKGDYITFIDSDDWVDAVYLMHLIKPAGKGVEYIVSGHKCIVEGEITSMLVPNNTCTFELGETGAEPFADLYSKNLLNGPCTKLYRRSIIIEHDIHFPLDVHYGEDLLFNYDYLRHVKFIASVAESDYYYRQVFGTSLSHKPRPDRFQNDYHQWQVRREFLISRNLWTPQLQQEMYLYLWGVVYDGLFEASANRTYSYISGILSIPEIRYLKQYAPSFAAAHWIKQAILHRCAFVFWVFFKVR